MEGGEYESICPGELVQRGRPPSLKGKGVNRENSKNIFRPGYLMHVRIPFKKERKKGRGSSPTQFFLPLHVVKHPAPEEEIRFCQKGDKLS
jgi:hypothetical protein